MVDLYTTGQGGIYSGIITAILIIDFLMIFAVVFLERKNPSSTLTWLFILLFLPLVGIFLYLLLSQNISRQRVYKLSREEVKVITNSLDKQKENMRDGRFTFSKPEAKRWSDLIKLNQVYGSAYFTQDNKIDIMTDGGHMFNELLNDSVFNLESYISKVEGIEICKNGEKYGKSVTKCDISKHSNGVVDLKDHWCYFYQIKQVINY